MKFFNKYVKGNLSSNNLQEQNIDDSLENQSRETEDKMFSKNYWFGENGENNEQQAPDPWLPQMVRLLKYFYVYITSKLLHFFWFLYIYQHNVHFFV